MKAKLRDEIALADKENGFSSSEIDSEFVEVNKYVYIYPNFSCN